MKRMIQSVLMYGLLALSGQVMAQELGAGRGIDHVGPLVRLENSLTRGFLVEMVE